MSMTRMSARSSKVDTLLVWLLVLGCVAAAIGAFIGGETRVGFGGLGLAIILGSSMRLMHEPARRF